MPELPEVETVARSLRSRILGLTLGTPWTSGLPLRRPIDAARLVVASAGARVDAIERRGKYLLIRLSRRGRASHVLLWHLGMSGRLLIENANSARAAHTHVAFALAPGAEELRYVDARRFGYLAALCTDEVDGSPELQALGVDPLSRAFTPATLAATLALSRRAAKDFLLEQGHIAGLGNIYASEALHAAGISPRRRADQLGPRRAARLHAAIVDVLTASIARRGTSFSDYVDAAGRAGDNRPYLAVYGRPGEPCRRCRAPIRRLVQGARSTFYCGGCQR